MIICFIADDEEGFVFVKIWQSSKMVSFDERKCSSGDNTLNEDFYLASLLPVNVLKKCFFISLG